MKLEVKLVLDCFKTVSYFGYKDGQQFTEGYDSLRDLVDDYPEFLGADIVYIAEVK